MKKIYLLSLLALATSLLQAQTLANFSLKNVLTGKEVSLKDFASSPGIVILFSSVACPFDSYYANRLKTLETTYVAKVPILLVNSYTEAPEDETWMIKAANANGISLPYLSDKAQTLMIQLGAQRSPEVFLLKNTSGQFSVIYHGAIDDNAQVEGAVKQAYLKTALENFMAGKPINTPTTRPVGCYIRKK